MKAFAKPQDWIDTENTPERRILDLREVGMRDALTLGRLQYHRAFKPLAQQCHEHWLVLVFLFTGVQRYLIDGREVILRGGEVLRILPGETYGTGEWPEQRGDLAWLILNPPENPGGAALGMTAEGTDAVFGGLLARSGSRVRPMPEEIPGLVMSIFDSWESRSALTVRELIRNRVAAIALAVVAAMDQTGKSADRANMERIQRVVEWLEQHAGEIPNTVEMARFAGLSTASFHRYFKQVTGCTPRDYELRLKIGRASAQLRRNPDASITHLAHDLGFASSQYFATVFKRYMGVSPTGYREGGE